MSRKIILITIIIGLVIIFGIYQGFIKKEESTFTLAEVSRGNISQEVSETGTVKKGEEINLNFKNAGRIEEIYVKVGDLVKSGEILAKLEEIELKIQLQEAQASLEVAQAKLDKLLAGTSSEEIKIAETEVENSQISLTTAKENLDQAYEDALNTLDDSYLKLYNASNSVDLIQRTYFDSTDQESTKVKENKDKIENATNLVKSHLDAAKDNPENENINLALSETKKALDTTSTALALVRELCETPIYRNTVTSADKTSLDTQRTNVNTALTNIANSQQTISSMNLGLNSAEGDLQKAQDQLALLKAKPQQEDINLYEAQIRQAQAQINLLEAQTEDASLRSPTEGEITKINKRIGEMAQPALAESIISLLPVNPFQVEVDIYEEDIVKINVGNSVDIVLTPFPDEILKGKVVSIDPAEKLIEGVVYYEITIDFEDPPERVHPVKSSEAGIPSKAELFNRVKPGMTADIIIRTASRENALVIPEEAIEKKDGKVVVQVLIGKTSQEREIEVGLIGSDDMVEVISGLKEGEEVVIK